MLGAGPAVTVAPDPSELPRLLAVSDASSAYVAAGVPRVRGDHPEHVPYRNEGYGPITLAESNVVQVVMRGPSVTVLHADGTVSETDQDEHGGERFRVRGPAMRWIAGSGADPVCGVTRGGEVYCWNNFGLDDGPPRRPRRLPGLSHVVRVAIEMYGSGIALLEDGTIRTFSPDGSALGVLSDAPVVEEDGFVIAQPALTDVVEVAVLAYTRCALRSDGTVWCWGEELAGSGFDETPTMLAGIDGVVSLHGNQHVLCVRRRDASVACSGDPPEGLVTFGEPAQHQDGFVVAPGLAGTTELVIGAHHACWLEGGDAVHPVRCIGHDALGELGVMPRRSAVLEVPGVRGATWIDTSGSRTCAGGPGGVWCWRAGNPVLVRDELPRAVSVPEPETIRAAWMSDGEACVLRASGARDCYSVVDGVFTAVSSLPGVLQIAGPCALVSSREIVCGTGTAPASASPGPFRTLTRAGTSIVALREDGRTLVTMSVTSADGGWTIGEPTIESLPSVALEVVSRVGGLCVRDELGTRCGRSTLIEGPSDELVGGDGGLACVRAGGSVTCRGFLDQPELMIIGGAEHPDAPRTPTPFPGLSDATAIAVGANHVCALRSNGTVACFGDARNGGVGDVPAWIHLLPVIPEL